MCRAIDSASRGLPEPASNARSPCGAWNDSARGPVLVLGTIWPEYWTVLTTPLRAAQLGTSDPHAQAMELLGNTGLPVPMR